MNREVHVRFCEGLGCNSLGLLTYSHRDRAKRTLPELHCLRGATQGILAPPVQDLEGADGGRVG